MDRLYGNVKEGHHSKWIDEAIYANDIGHDVESDNTVYALAGHAGLKVNTKRSCRAAALFLGLLCLLLLAGLVALVFLYTRDNSNWKTERVHLQTSLAEEKDQLNKTLALQSQEKWIYFRRSFYYVSSTRKPWNESRWDCRQKDADLEFVRRWKTRMWIGLSDTEKEGTWTWVDGSPLGSQSYWAKSEPNDAKGVEDCAEIHSYDEQQSWNDAPCQNEKDWICERRVK
ncbi:CD209 antigen-like protein C isoform X3 [Betta splendens]|uniref:CD209 antigen-like protein C isoform X3 n=1 Tax=Betta splendens TaxID=158456 RepID=A0A9W2XUR8_BETSP|nr:CD209 antigen-like protein C isoform X3 [Betta splendens]